MRIKVLCFYTPYMTLQNTSQQDIFDQTEFKDAVKEAYDPLLRSISSEENVSAAETINAYRLVVPSSSAFKSTGVQALSVLQEELSSQFKSNSSKLNVHELEINKFNLFQYLYFVAHHNGLQDPYSEIEMDFYYPEGKEDEVEETIEAIKDVLPFNVKINFKRDTEIGSSRIPSVQGKGLIDPHYEANVHVEPSNMRNSIFASLGDKKSHLKFHIKIIKQLKKLGKNLKERNIENPFEGYIEKMNDLIRIQVIAQDPWGLNLFVRAQDLLNDSLRYMSNPAIIGGVCELLDSVFEMIKDLDPRNPNYKLNFLDSSHQEESAMELLSSAIRVLHLLHNYMQKSTPEELRDLKLAQERHLKLAQDRLAHSHHGKEVAGKALKVAGIFSITLPVFAFIALPLLIAPTFTLPLAVIAAGLYAAFTIAAVFAGALLGHVGNNKIAQAKAEQSVKRSVTDNASTFFKVIKDGPFKIVAKEKMGNDDLPFTVPTDPVLLMDYSAQLSPNN